SKLWSIIIESNAYSYMILKFKISLNKPKNTLARYVLTLLIVVSLIYSISKVLQIYVQKKAFKAEIGGIVLLLKENKELYTSLFKQDSRTGALEENISTTLDQIKENNQSIQNKLTSISDKGYYYLNKRDQNNFSNLRIETLDLIVQQRKFLNEFAEFYLLTSPIYGYEPGPVYSQMIYSQDSQKIKIESSFVSGGALGISKLLNEFFPVYIDATKVKSLSEAYNNYSEVFQNLSSSSNENEYNTNLKETFSETIKLRQQTYNTLVSGLQSEEGSEYLLRYTKVLNAYNALID
ncbi:MAG: hypothetical protein KC414_14710, partial [Romboutsia sp.]|nr:hypothetical protein [Romboutsia sp.]